MKRSVNFSRLKPATLRRKLMTVEEIEEWIAEQTRRAEAKQNQDKSVPPESKEEK